MSQALAAAEKKAKSIKRKLEKVHRDAGVRPAKMAKRTKASASKLAGQGGGGKWTIAAQNAS